VAPNLSKSLSRDVRRKAKTEADSGEDDAGDRKRT
jgi:hypothetical protein